MCGICGIISRHDFPGKAAVEAMCAALRHRGPDEEGFFLRPNVSLGMRRLRIIDLATGRQPISNENLTLHVIYNGEIYNYRELRAELTALGHVFSTRTDTEVIVHGYEEWGLEAISRFNGMFAFALYDEREHRLILARDRAGQKPLFYHWNGQRLAFSSELKALLRLEDVPRDVDGQAIYHYLSLQYVPGPNTILTGVRQVPPGHCLIFAGGDISVQRYWRPDYRHKAIRTQAKWIERTRELTEQAVRRHMVSDVPIGVYLSGGVDSSVVAAEMSRHGPLKTFSIGFDVEAYNELEHARRIARRYGTDHHEFVVTADEVLATLEDVVWFSDQPLADVSCLPTFHLARLTREHVTVALTGDGGDEVFAGYTRYVLDRWLRWFRLLPDRVRQQWLPAIVKRLPDNAHIPTDRNVVAGLKRLAQASSTSYRASILAWGSFFTESQKAELLCRDWLKHINPVSTVALLGERFDEAAATTRLDRTLAVDFQTYLADDLLVKADRMAMAHSLETRAPFLDNSLIELGMQMPEALKIRGWDQKWALRQAFRDSIPAENVRRIKRGFGIPIGVWLRGRLRERAREILLDQRTLQRGYFNPDAVEALLEEHQRGTVDHGQRIWALMVLELWHRQYVDNNDALKFT